MQSGAHESTRLEVPLLTRQTIATKTGESRTAAITDEKTEFSSKVEGSEHKAKKRREHERICPRIVHTKKAFVAACIYIYIYI